MRTGQAVEADITAMAEASGMSREAIGSLVLLQGILAHTCPKDERERVAAVLLSANTDKPIVVVDRRPK
jgi:hypothetical protein